MAKNDLNRCEFIGHIGNNPELKYLQNEQEVVNFSLACNWKGKESEGVEWVRVVAFGKLAKICSDYLSKGSQVYISGRMRTNKWQDKDGKDRFTTEIIANEMQMLDSKGDSGAQPSGNSASKPAKVTQVDNGMDNFDSDIPF